MATGSMEDCFDTSHTETSNTATGTLTSYANLAHITDHKPTMNRILQNGNQPTDWLQYLQSVENNWTTSNHQERLSYLDQGYRKARECIPLENNKSNQALADIYINSARIKSQLKMEAKARFLLRFARANFRGIAKVHLAAAQFEMDNGDKEKAIAILQKANIFCPKNERLTVALTRARSGLRKLEDTTENNATGKSTSELPLRLAPVEQSGTQKDLTDTATSDPHQNEIPHGNSDTLITEKTTSELVLPVAAEQSSVRRDRLEDLPATGNKEHGNGGFNHGTNSAFSKVATTCATSNHFSNSSSHGTSHIPSTPAQGPISTPYGKGALRIDPFSSGFKRPPSTSKLRSLPQRVRRQKIVVSDDDDEDDDDDNDLGRSVKPLVISPPARLSSADIHLPTELSVITEDGDSGITVETPPTDDLSVNTQEGPKFQFSSGLDPIREVQMERRGVNFKEEDSPKMAPLTKPEIPTVSDRPIPVVSLPNKSESTLQESQPAPTSSHPMPSSQPNKVLKGATELRNQLLIKGVIYTIIKVIGKGGSSKVYQVLHEGSNKIFAVKYVDLECADDLIIQSYKNEITLLQRLQNKEPIIKLYDFEIAPSHIYLVMECGSIDLASFLRRKRVAKEDILFYWRQMLTAVQCIHDEGIIHRDLKPANFLFVEGSLKLIDFGIANSIQSDRTSVTREAQVGTLNYMSPEMIQNSGDEQGASMKINCKSDVWSLGCILYYIIYGKTPFQHITNTMMKLQAICNPDYQIQFSDVSEVNLIDTVKSCLVRDVKKRPSIKELLETYDTMKNSPNETPKPAVGSNMSLQSLMSMLNDNPCSSPRSMELAMALKKYLGKSNPDLDKENRKPLQEVGGSAVPKEDRLFFPH